MTKLFSALLLVMLVGCDTTPKVPTIVPDDRVVQLDPKLLELCKPDTLQPIIPTGPNGTAVEKDFYINAAANAKIYESCKNKQEASVTQLKKFSNIKE